MNAIDSLNQAIQSARENWTTQQLLTKKLGSTQNALSDAENHVRDLKVAYKKEMRDVEKMTSLSLSNFLSTLMNNKHVRLEKEEQEAYEAKIRLDTAIFEKERIEEQMEQLRDQLISVQGSEKTYQKALNEKLEWLKNHGVSGHEDLLDQEQQLQGLEKQQKEIREASYAANQVISQAKVVMNLLQSAENWSTFDMFGGGVFATMVKREKMDAAKAQMDQLKHCFSTYNREIADVSAFDNASIHLADFGVADYFECFFVDLSVHHKITEASTQIARFVMQVQRTCEELSIQLSNAQEQYQTLQANHKKQIEEFA